MLKLLLLLVSLAVLWWFVRNDASEYAAFKRQPDTAGRQHFYGTWMLKSFLALFGTSIVCLLILRQLHALLYLPDEFIPLAARLGADMPTTVILDKEILAGCAAGAMLIGILLGVFIAKRLKTSHATLGDIEPLMPRNAAETGWAALLSLNAGLSEECFFRLGAAAAADRRAAQSAAGVHQCDHPVWPGAHLPGRDRRGDDDAGGGGAGRALSVDGQPLDDHRRARRPGSVWAGGAPNVHAVAASANADNARPITNNCFTRHRAKIHPLLHSAQPTGISRIWDGRGRGMRHCMACLIPRGFRSDETLYGSAPHN